MLCIRKSILPFGLGGTTKAEDVFILFLEEVAYGKGKHFLQVLPLRYRLTYSVLHLKISSFQATEQS